MDKIGFENFQEFFYTVYFGFIFSNQLKSKQNKLFWLITKKYVQKLKILTRKKNTQEISKSQQIESYINSSETRKSLF